MGTFHYLGIDSSGRRVSGVIAADNARAARERLRNSGVSIRKVDERHATEFDKWMQPLRRRRISGVLTEFTRELATLLQAGVPLLDALDCALPQSHKCLQAPIASIRDRIAGGDSLAEAMKHESWMFDDMIIGMVRVGEHSGNLEEVLDQIASFREQSAQLKDRVLSAIMYPTIVLLVSFGVTLFLMTIVVPMLLRNLAELGSELPWPTRILKFLSDSLLIHGWWIGIIIAATMGMLAFWLRTEAGKMGVSRLLLRLPVIGMLVQKQAIGRIALVVACLLRSGVELVEALAIAANSCNNMVIRNAILQSNADLQKGIALKESFGRHAVFPASVVQVLVLGQQSGQIEKMLQRLGTDYDKQASFLASRIASVTEPILILLLSVVVGFILFATVLPILEAGNVLIN